MRYWRTIARVAAGAVLIASAPKARASSNSALMPLRTSNGQVAANSSRIEPDRAASPVVDHRVFDFLPESPYAPNSTTFSSPLGPVGSVIAIKVIECLNRYLTRQPFDVFLPLIDPEKGKKAPTLRQRRNAKLPK